MPLTEAEELEMLELEEEESRLAHTPSSQPQQFDADSAKNLAHEAIVKQLDKMGFFGHLVGNSVGLMQKTGDAVAGNVENIKDIGARVKSGETGLGSAAIQGASEVISAASQPIAQIIPEPVKKAVGAVAGAASRLPSNVPSAPTMGELASKTKQSLDEVDPDIARNIGAGANIIANIAGVKGAKPAMDVAGDVATGVGKIVKKTSAVKSPKTLKQSEIMGGLSEEQYKILRESKEPLPIQFTNEYADMMAGQKPKPLPGHGLTSEDKKFLKHITEISPVNRRQYTFDDIREIDRKLTEKINNEVSDLGVVKPMGQKLMSVRSNVRKLINEIPDRPETVNLTKAKIYWSASKMLEDLEEAAARADRAANKGIALQGEYRQLLKDETWGKSIPGLRDMVEQASRRHLGDEALGAIANRLGPLIVGSIHGPAAAIGSFTAGIAAREGVGRMVAARGVKAQKQIVSEAMKRAESATMLKSKPKEALRIPPKEKLSPLPLSEEQLAIEQAKLRTRKNANTPGVTPTAVRPIPTPEQLPMKLLPPPNRRILIDAKGNMRPELRTEYEAAYNKIQDMQQKGMSWGTMKATFDRDMRLSIQKFDDLKGMNDADIQKEINAIFAAARKDIREAVRQSKQNVQEVKDIKGQKRDTVMTEAFEKSLNVERKKK